MRSRYCAFVMGRGEYILNTQAAQSSDESAQLIASWARSVKWMGLEIIRTERGTAADARGTVEFEARYEESGEVVVQRETSRFDKVAGRWRYIGGRIRNPQAKR
jgi:SEC-C motif-containing protein